MDDVIAGNARITSEWVLIARELFGGASSYISYILTQILSVGGSTTDFYSPVEGAAAGGANADWFFDNNKSGALVGQDRMNDVEASAQTRLVLVSAIGRGVPLIIHLCISYSDKPPNDVLCTCSCNHLWINFIESIFQDQTHLS